MSHTYKHERSEIKHENRRLLDEEMERRRQYLNWVYYLNHYHDINFDTRGFSLTSTPKTSGERSELKQSPSIQTKLKGGA